MSLPLSDDESLAGWVFFNVAVGGFRGVWNVTLVANIRRTVADNDGEDDGWISWGEKRTLRTSLL